MAALNVRICLLLLVGGLLAGCGQSSSSDEQAVQTTPPPSASCLPDDEVVRKAQQDPRSLVGDVDGDGQDDKIHLTSVEQAPLKCRHFLVLDGAGGARVLALRGQALSPTLRLQPTAQPDLIRLAQVDPSRGLEIVLGLQHGAGSTTVGVFSYLDGELNHMPIVPSRAAGWLIYGSGGLTFEVVDCLGSGKIVASFVALHGKLREVDRNIFVIKDGEIRLERQEHHSVERLTFPEFAKVRDSPFRNCPEATT